ncbi:Protein pih1d3, partial [Halocaridina rubra]
MADFPSPIDVKKLVQLVAPRTDDDDDDIEASIAHGKKNSGITPASIGYNNTKPNTFKQTDKNSTSNTKKKDDILGNIWDIEEVQSDQRVEPSDPRTRPKYDITYRQRLSASQVYLPISSAGFKGHGEEDLIVKVIIPGDLLTEVTLEVNSSTLDLASPNYLLHLPLPRSVDQRKGVATWDPTEHTLMVTLPVLDTPLLTPVSK